MTLIKYLKSRIEHNFIFRCTLMYVDPDLIGISKYPFLVLIQGTPVQKFMFYVVSSVHYLMSVYSSLIEEFYLEVYTDITDTRLTQRLHRLDFIQLNNIYVT